MCGRYTLTKLIDVLAHFPVAELPTGFAPRYNIAPSQPVLAITNAKPERFEFYRWGLVPSWAKDVSIGNKMINARAETLKEKPAFKGLLARRRCLVLADGFYEWRKEPDGKTKTPMYIRMRGGSPFAFAGLWDEWHAPDGSTLPTLTLITTTPNALMTSIHNRMPVILPRDRYAPWLDAAEKRVDFLSTMLAPYPADVMEAGPVSRTVNNPANESPACIEPAVSEMLF